MNKELLNRIHQIVYPVLNKLNLQNLLYDITEENCSLVAKKFQENVTSLEDAKQRLKIAFQEYNIDNYLSKKDQETLWEIFRNWKF